MPAATMGCRARSMSRRTGVPRIAASTTTAPICSTATIRNATPGDDTAMIALPSAGPAACMIVGRRTPSMPFAASNSSASISAGNHAEYAG